MSYIVDRRHLDFLLYDVLGLERLLQTESFTEWDRNSVEQLLETAEKIATKHFLECAAEVDANEPVVVNGRVILPDSIGECLSAQAEAGFFALPFDAESGGLQAPWLVHMAASGIFNCANTSVANYAFLTIAATNLLRTFGDKNLKDRYLPQMLAGRWFGTMCLSEPQAGSSLADIRTKATPRGDGSYALTGSKMWISGGDHDISENIVHFVLAKIPGGPSGTKGISLFLVPKFRGDEDGELGACNNISLVGLNHKMGQRGTTNCLLNFGETGVSIGYLVGEAHQGLSYMFQMMNEARIGVGYAATMQGLGGYLYSAQYAHERLQGRSIAQKNSDTGQVPIIEHVDVRRMLLAQKAAVEGAQALCLYAAKLVDEINTETDRSQVQRAEQLLGLLTPVVKSWPSEHCLEANKWAIQILGGYGYTRDYPVERLYRDNRLNHIHEGTFAIQGMDLVGRKILGDGGQALGLLFEKIGDTIAAVEERFPEEASALHGALAAVTATVDAMSHCPDKELRLANATLFLDAFGSVVIAWIWLKMLESSVRVAVRDGDDFHHGLQVTCRYYYRFVLPKALTELALLAKLDPTCRDAPFGIFPEPKSGGSRA